MKSSSWAELEAAFVAQEQIISAQAGIIDQLFRLLAQHIDSEELSSIPAIWEIREAAKLKHSIGMDVEET